MWNDERHFLLFFSEINGYMSVLQGFNVFTFLLLRKEPTLSGKRPRYRDRRLSTWRR